MLVHTLQFASLSNENVALQHIISRLLPSRLVSGQRLTEFGIKYRINWYRGLTHEEDHF